MHTKPPAAPGSETAAQKGPAATPLDGVRVISIEQFAAGPWATLQLADLGAEVIKLEDPESGGDLARHVPPYAQAGSSLYFESFNRGKLSVALDLNSDDGRAAFEDLVRHADVVFANVRGDVVGKLGIGYDRLSKLNSRIVSCSLSGHGRTGPRAGEGAYDHTIQAIAGWQAITGEPDGPPVRSGVSMVDFSAGYAAAAAILAAVLESRRSGRGGDVDISLQEVAIAQLSYLATWTASRSYQPHRHISSSHPTLVPFQTFRAADDWLVIACPKDSLWTRLCEAIDRPDLAKDPRYATIAGRSRGRARLVDELDATLATRSVDEWCERLRAAQVPHAPVNGVEQALADEQIQARESIAEYEHPVLGTVRQPASPLRFGDRPEVGRAPFLGEHTQTVLSTVCGYGPDRLRRFHDPDPGAASG